MGAIDPTICPLCGADNACGAQAGETSCWCFEVTIPSRVLEALPPEARRSACVCRSCATRIRAEDRRELPLTRR